jgi:hypothetical protein
MAVFYKKLNSSVKENLDDDYPNVDDYSKNVKQGKDAFLNHYFVKVVNSFKTENGLKVKATANRNPNGELVGTLEPELKINSLDVTLSGKAATDRKFETTIARTDLFQKGTRLYLKDIIEDGKFSFEGGFEYKESNFAVDGKVTKPLGDGDFKGVGSGVLHNSGISLGGDVEYIHNKGFSKYSTKFQFENNGGTFCIAFNDERIPKKSGDSLKSDLSLSYSTTLTPELKGAVDTKINQNRDTRVRFGFDYKIDGTSNLRSKVSVQQKEMRLGLLYKQKVTASSKFYAAADLNVGLLTGTFAEAERAHLFSATFSYGDD